MKRVIVAIAAAFLFLFSSAYSSTKHRIDTNKSVEDQITFWLITKDGEEYQLTNNLQLVDPNKQTKFLIHGWFGSRFTEWYGNIEKAFFSIGDYNIIEVDWAEPSSSQEHVVAYYNTFIVGQVTGEFIEKLYSGYNISLNSIEIVGHSFGGHIGGFTGKAVYNLTGLKVGRVTAMDPARPRFEDRSVTQEKRLFKDDADVVVTIHTDAGVNGYLSPIGPIDFYPNGGSATQPGCDTSGCSHNIVTDFYVEAIQNSKGFISTKCQSYENYQLDMCVNETKVNLGGNLSIQDAGVYYLYTNPESPYSKE